MAGLDGNHPVGEAGHNTDHESIDVVLAALTARLDNLTLGDLADVDSTEFANPGDTIGFYQGKWTPTPVPPDLTPGLWADVTLGAALTADATYFPLQARQEAGQEIRLTGRATAATWANNDVLATVPVGFRPARAVSVRVGINGGDAPVTIGTDGTVRAQSIQTSPGFLAVETAWSQIVPTVVTPVVDVMPTVRASSTAASTSSVSTLNCALPTGIIGGDYILVAAASRVALPTWTPPSGYTQIAFANPSGSYFANIVLFGKVASGTVGAASPDASATVTCATTGGPTAIEIVSLVLSEGTYDAAITDTATTPLFTNAATTAPTFLTTTTGHAKARLFGFAIQNNSTTTAPTWTANPNGWTQVADVNGHNGTQSQKLRVLSFPQDTAGATPAGVIASNSSTQWVTLAYPVRGKAGGGGVITPPVREWAAGTWLLDQVESVAEVTSTAAAVNVGLAMDGCTGYSVRAKWNLLEPNGNGVYDFGVFNKARELHPTAKLSIRFMAGKHTPTAYKGYSWWAAGTPGVTYPCPFNDPTGPDANTPGNVAFDNPWFNMVEALAAWCRNDQVVHGVYGVRLLHCAAYGHDWAEMYAGRIGPPVTELRAKAGFTEAKFVAGHQQLFDRAVSNFAGTDLTLEFPAGGTDLNGMGGDIMAWLAARYPTDYVFHQANTLGAAWSFGPPAGNCTFGGQAYASGGPTNQSTTNRNTLTWDQYYNQATNSASSAHCLYVENYLDSFSDATDRAALATPMANWVPDPRPVG